MVMAAPPVRRSKLAPILEPLNAFLGVEASGGILLMVATIAAIAWANSPWRDGYHGFWHMKVAIGVGTFSHLMSLEHWVNDGLMAVFFLLVGLEIKRELVLGELASIRQAALPVLAAIGGMVVPALLYIAVNAGTPGAQGWGIPMATDIAFAVGAVVLVGRTLPTSVKVFLLAIAIVDDLGAVMVIAFFYTKSVSVSALGVAAAFLALLVLLNILNIHRPLPYILLGLGLWVATLVSGIHATLAGVLLAFTIPATRQIEELPYAEYVRQMLSCFERETASEPDRITDAQSHALHAMAEASRAVQTPLARVEHALLKPVSFIVVPMFALANAGVDVGAGTGSSLGSPISLGIVLGLVIGKPAGILLASWLAVRTGIATLPREATWAQTAGVAVLCGIGFTMSLFVASLAFGPEGNYLATAKVGILAASLAAGIIGAAILFAASTSKRADQRQVLLSGVGSESN